MLSDNDYRRCKYQGNTSVCNDLLSNKLVHLNDTKLDEGIRTISFNGSIPSDLKSFLRNTGVFIINRAAQPINSFKKVVIDYSNGRIKLTYHYEGFISDFTDVYVLDYSIGSKSFRSIETLSSGSLIQAFSHIDIAKNAMSEWANDGKPGFLSKMNDMYDSKDMALTFLNLEFK